MDANEFDGKDLDDALAAASVALGRPASEIDYELLEGGRKGVFGLGARPVRIRAASAGSPPPAPGVPPPPAKPVAKQAAAPTAKPAAASTVVSGPGTALAGIIANMGFALSIEENRRDGGIELRLDGPDRKRLIAKDGELLSALEFVLNRMGRRAWPDEPPVHVVCSGFRSERDGELVEMVREAAAEVTRSGQPCRLHAMNPYERRVVHMTVREHPGLTTVSEGDGFLKRVRVEKSAP